MANILLRAASKAWAFLDETIRRKLDVHTAVVEGAPLDIERAARADRDFAGALREATGKASRRRCTCPENKPGTVCLTIGGARMGDHMYSLHTKHREIFACAYGCGCLMHWKRAAMPRAMEDLNNAEQPGRRRWNPHDWCTGNPVESS